MNTKFISTQDNFKLKYALAKLATEEESNSYAHSSEFNTVELFV